MRSRTLRRISAPVVLAIVMFGCGVVSATLPTGYVQLQALSAEFWGWRAVTSPLAGDDITRIDRAPGWVPDWTPASVQERRHAFAAFLGRYTALDPSAWSTAQQVDYRLMGSALARVEWELDVNPAWRRNPLFYIAQTLGSVFEILLMPPPFDAQRSADFVQRLEHIPATVAAAQANLDDPVRPFAELTIGALQRVRPTMTTVATSVAPLLEGVETGRLDAATENAIVALEQLRDWLAGRLDAMATETAIGRDAYNFFLSRVAIMPFAPEQLVDMARQEWDRAVGFEAYERLRNADLPQLPLAADLDEQIAGNAAAEAQVREFLEQRDILSVPAWVQHYRNAPMPAYLAPLASLGVNDDLTSPARLGDDGVKYIPPPSPDMSYFYLATARDPRPILVHEGIPGHYLQLVVAWAHDNAMRRNYYDSGANEGIGFYAEEMMLQAGYFDDSPRTREIIYNFMRLRALRVEVDVKLAIGEFSIAQAAEYLHRTVPMDAPTALEEAAFFASTPGQAISYQIGKLQIQQLVSEARVVGGEAFSLRQLHDFVWLNGNVPIALQRWEVLGLDDQIRKIDAAASH